jgi:hydroxymethylpyrimidine kinase/phosphomethylpyrimidine kinase/thiamine-phosphate diphosphorylase
MNESVVLSIAGTDPSGGAGIQADLKTFQGLGVYGCSAITAVIAQNTVGVERIEPVSECMLAAQLKALETDVPAHAIKIGMIGTAGLVRVIAQWMRGRKAFVVYDPVMISGSGHSLLDEDAVAILKEELLPRVDVLTPNIAEAERLTGRKVSTFDDMLEAAKTIRLLGPRSVLLKGGHLAGAVSSDLWMDDAGCCWLNSPRVPSMETHGTGCTLSSAIAACVALGRAPCDAAVIGKAYINQGLRLACRVGRGRVPLAHRGWPANPADMPWITQQARAMRGAPFPGCGDTALGFYPLVARAREVEPWLSLGVRTIQLRAKDLGGSELESEVGEAVAVARRFDARLFINDEWRLALKHRAYGVHLGAEDLEQADLDAIREAGVRLGASAYTYTELARALALRPSYIGLGAVFATGSKEVQTPPLGVEGFRRMCRLSDVPVVAIGGVTLERARDLLNAGADGLAVISDVSAAPDPAQRVREWMAFMERYTVAQRTLDQR